MKKDIHPQWNKKVPVIVNGQTVMNVGSTSVSLESEIWSGNHPFYTGKQMLVDTDNLVEKFKDKQAKAQNLATQLRKKKDKRKNRVRSSAVSNQQVTLKDMLKNFN